MSNINLRSIINFAVLKLGNLGFGKNALKANTTGYDNIAIGENALAANTTGNRNVIIGRYASQSGVSLESCVSIGSYSAGSSQSVAIGAGAVTPATKSVAIGYNSAAAGSSVSIGWSAAAANTGGQFVAIGDGSLGLCTTGNSNTAIGYSSGLYNVDGSSFTTFNGCTFLGAHTRVSGSSQLQLGNSSSLVYSQQAINLRSDVRDKTDIRSTVLGLEFISKLRPVDYRLDFREDYILPSPTLPEEPSLELESLHDLWVSECEAIKLAREQENIQAITNKDGSKKRNRFHHGLIAQEVKEVLDELGIDFGGYQDHKIKGGCDVYSIGYTELIAPLIKAIQELKARVEALEEV
jgi:hypothetical protein